MTQNYAPEIPEALVTSLESAGRVVVLTGSGISAESGIPTFREAQSGLWSQYDPQELATPQAFQRNPRLVWEWYTWRRELVAQANPNPGHLALVRLQALIPGFTLITQNVDGLHQRAGSHDVIELHGNLVRSKCSVEGIHVKEWSDDDQIPPQCPSCGGLLRPDVVWFGEALPEANLAKAIEASQNCDVFLSIGTSTVVQPAASLPFYAKRQGAVVAEINLNPTPLSPSADHVICGPAGIILPALLSAASFQ